MQKRILSLLMCVLVVVILPLTSFAADRTTKEYWIEFFKSGKEVTVEVARSLTYEENLARMDAMAEINAQNRKPVATSTDDATIIANIQKTYGVMLELGDEGFYDKKAKTTQHLTNIQSGLGYLGSVFTKKLAKTFEDKQGAKDMRAEWGDAKPYRGRFTLHLDPRVDEKDSAGNPITVNWGIYETGGGRINLYGYNSYPVTARTLVHEYGHALEDVAHGVGDAPAPFGDMKGVVYGEGNGSVAGGTTIKSFPADKFVSAYAANAPKEDYAETFAVAVMNGADKPYKGGKDTILYKKFKVIYDDLMQFAGADSRATQRVGGYLGLNP